MMATTTTGKDAEAQMDYDPYTDEVTIKVGKD
jgi:hypothetical protein